MNYRLTVFFIGLIFPIIALGQDDVPDFKCVSYDEASGNITLSWDFPTNTSDIINYNIYVSNQQSGPFTLLNQAAPTENTYTYAPPSVAVYYFEIKSQHSANESQASEVLSSIVLNATVNGNELSLSWNPSLSDYFINNGLDYKIYESDDGITFSQIGSSNSNSYTSYICNYLKHYRVDADSDNCTSKSSVISAQGSDLSSPTGPVLTLIDVDNSGNTSLYWDASPESDVDRYVIEHYEFENNRWKWIKHDSVPANILQYTDTEFDACTEQQTFVVYAVDHCGNRFAPDQLNPPTTMLLNDPVFDKCESETILNWEAYKNPANPVQSYEIWVTENGGTAQLLQTVSSTTTEWTHTNQLYNRYYTYSIKAVMGSLKSSACDKIVYTEANQVSSFIDIRSASVKAEGGVDLHIHFDYNDDLDKIMILRSDEATTQMIPVSEHSALSGNTITVEDLSATTDVKPYYYMAQTYDNCGVMTQLSNEVKTIYLSAEQKNSQEIALEWNHYQSQNQDVSNYRVYYSADGLIYSILDEVAPTMNSYLHNISNSYSSEGKFNYYVQAILNDITPFGNNEQAKSNIVEVKQDIKILIPDAFAPEGKNKVFKPVSSGIPENKYSMSIYNKWGQKLFSTSTPEEGWDGTYKNVLSPTGAYVYVIRYEDPDQGMVEYKGTVLLIR